MEDVPPRGLLRAPGRGQLGWPQCLGRLSSLPRGRGAAAVSPPLPQCLPPALFAWDAVFRVVLTRPGGEHASSEPHACRVHARLHTHVLCAHVFSRARVRVPVRAPCPGGWGEGPLDCAPAKGTEPRWLTQGPGCDEWILLSSVWGGRGGGAPGALRTFPVEQLPLEFSSGIFPQGGFSGEGLGSSPSATGKLGSQQARLWLPACAFVRECVHVSAFEDTCSLHEGAQGRGGHCGRGCGSASTLPALWLQLG